MQSAPHRSNVGPFGLPWGIAVILSVVYVLSPIDALPEMPLGCIGLVDDLCVACYGVYALIRALTGGGAATTTVQAIVPESYTATAEARNEPPFLTMHPPVRIAEREPAAAISGEAVSGVFEVDVQSENGAEARVEVEARNAEHAREIVSGLGGEGRIASVRLLRVRGASAT